MSKRKIEIFSAGCPICDDTINSVNELACCSCEIIILDTHKSEHAARAKELGIRSLPAVLVDGKLADCCVGHGVDSDKLSAAGVGSPV